MTDYRLVFHGSLYQPATLKLRHRIAEVLLQKDCTTATIVFSSDGGNTEEALSLYNFIRALPRPISIHAAGHVGSSAVPVFLAGHNRTCSPISRFFFHAYDWSFAGKQLAEQITEATQRLDSDIELSRQIVGRHTTMPPGTLSGIYRRSPNPLVVEPSQAKEWGLVHEIVELNELGQVQPNVAVWTVGY
jgi:ATP-dependent Clp protease protease subunit